MWGHEMNKERLATLLGVAAALGVIAVAFVWPFVRIEWRLAWNQPAARAMAEALTLRHPGLQFTGAASYERDIIYIRVNGQADEATLTDVRDWLATERDRRGLAVRIELRLADRNGRESEPVEF